MPYHHVLTIYDGTPESVNLLDMVCRIVRPHRARLTILAVKIVPLTKPLPVHQPGADPEVDALAAQAEKTAERLGVRAATAVRYARALGPAVVSEARVRGVDLIALLAPDLDRIPWEEGMAHEVETVLRQATCGVMLCRPSREEAPPTSLV